MIGSSLKWTEPDAARKREPVTLIRWRNDRTCDAAHI